MTPEDINLYLRIRRQRKLTRQVTAVVFVLVLVEIVAVVFTSGEPWWLMSLLWGTLGGAAVSAFNEWMSGPQDELLDLVERQISREPAALDYLARRRAA